MVLFLAKQIITLYNAVQKALTKDQHALVKKCRDEEKIKSDLVSKIHCLKLFSRRQSPEQQADINALKEQGLVDDIKQKFPQLVFRRFALHEVRNLFVELNRADFGEWFLHDCQSNEMGFLS